VKRSLMTAATQAYQADSGDDKVQ